MNLHGSEAQDIAGASPKTLRPGLPPKALVIQLPFPDEKPLPLGRGGSVRIALLVLPLLFMIPAAFAQECAFATSVFTEALPYISAAILLSVAAAAVAYMAGSFTRDAGLLVFAKDQVFHTFISVLLVVGIQGIFFGSCTMVAGAVGGDPLEISVSYLHSLKAEGTYLLTALMRSSMENKFEASWMFGYFLPFTGGETFWDDAFRSAYSRHAEIAFDFVMAGYVSAGIQYLALKAVRDYALPVLLPIGLILRALPRGRDAGNTVLALAFAVYIILPLAYAVNSSGADISGGFCGTGRDEVFGNCGDSIGMGTIAVYILNTVFLPNFALVVFASSATALVKVAKVIP
ncbi:MAG: hypothetical protein AB1657_01685 [Candidatus Micrarchaeota archaeon]